MSPVLTVARFEWQYHWQRPVTYLFAGLIFGHGIWSAFSMATVYPESDSGTNAYVALSSLGVVLAMVCVLLAGQSLTKDQEFRAAAYLYTLPVTSRSYLIGRFLGTLLTALTLSVFYPLGTLTAAFFTDPSGPLPWLALAHGFASLMVENVFIVVSLAFSLTVFMRGIRGAYVVLFLVVLYFLLAENQPDNGVLSDVWTLLDPFGVGMIRESIDDMRQTDTADTLLPFSDMLLINRVLWLGLALGLLTQAEAAFSFQTHGQPAPTRRRRAVAVPPSVQKFTGPVHFSFGSYPRVRLIGRLARLNFLTLIRQPLFRITTGLLVLLSILLATALGQNSNFPELPLTSAMTALRLPIGLFISLFLLIMTGELFFQERTIGLWPIVDALPQPALVGLAAKALALIGVAFLLTCALFMTGVGIQIGHRFGDIDWSLYARDLLLDGLLRFGQLIALSAFIAVVVNNRIMSHVVAVLVFLLLWLAYQAGSGNSSYLYSFLPGSSHYSNLTGYGTDGSIRPLVHLMWWGVAGLLGTLTGLFWNRGTPVGFIARLRAGWQRFNRSYGLTCVIFMLGFGLALWHVQHETGAPVASGIRGTTSFVYASALTGKQLTVKVLYHDGYQVQHILNAARFALRRGEALFGPYPQTDLQITEVPHSADAIRSGPGALFLSEKEGWTADYRQVNNVDYIDYLISREIFNQWLTHRMQPVRQAGDGFLRQSLAEYLALHIVRERYGTERFRQQINQRFSLYTTARNRTRKPEKTLLQSSGDDALERGRGALMLTSIGQVWGDTTLSRTIGQFYQMAVHQPTSATATAFAAHLTSQLPDSLRYLTAYLSDRLWFNFRIGRIASLPNGLFVEIIPQKWRDNNVGPKQRLLINDLIPLSVYDRNGNEIYNALVRPEPDERWARLPVLYGAARVVIDPLGTWPETNKRDNRKLF